jgi:hypothetical protein
LSCFAPITSHVMSTKGHVTCQVACGKGLVACYTHPLTPVTSRKQIWSENKGCVNYTVALPFTGKRYLKAKEELWKLKYFTIATM